MVRGLVLHQVEDGVPAGDTEDVAAGAGEDRARGFGPDPEAR